MNVFPQEVGGYVVVMMISTAGNVFWPAIRFVFGSRIFVLPAPILLVDFRFPDVSHEGSCEVHDQEPACICDCHRA